MNCMTKKFILPPLVGILAFAVFLPFGVQAQQSSGLAVSPLTFEIAVNPGDTVTNAIRVFNPNSQPVSVRLHVEDFSAEGERGQAIIAKAESTSYSIAQWVSLDQGEVLVEPNVAALVNFTIRIPANAEPGGHYGAITAEAGGGAAAGSGASVAQKVASLLLVSVSGEVSEALKIVDFTGPAGAVLDASAVTLASRFENTGSVHLKPRGFVTITDTFGREVANISLDQRNVLPGSKRLVETTWQPEGFTMGRMRAQLAAIYGSTNEPLTASVEFWVIPMNVIGPMLAVLGVLLVLGFILRKRLVLAFSILVRGQRSGV